MILNNGTLEFQSGGDAEFKRGQGVELGTWRKRKVVRLKWKKIKKKKKILKKIIIKENDDKAIRTEEGKSKNKNKNKTVT